MKLIKLFQQQSTTNEFRNAEFRDPRTGFCRKTETQKVNPQSIFNHLDFRGHWSYIISEISSLKEFSVVSCDPRGSLLKPEEENSLSLNFFLLKK